MTIDSKSNQDLQIDFIDLQEKLKDWIVNHARKTGVVEDTLTLDLLLNSSAPFNASVLHTELYYKIVQPDVTSTSTDTLGNGN